MRPQSDSVDALVARLRSTNWQDTGELSQALAQGFSSIAREQTFNRKLHNDTVVDASGGTLLAVSDPSAFHQSISMQPPQLMLLRKQGALATRGQTRAELNIKTIPALVLEVNGEGENATLKVAMVASKPKLEVEPSTSQNQAGDALQDIYNIDDSTQFGEIRTITMGGLPFTTLNEGVHLPVVGQTIMVTIGTNSEKQTIWIRKDRVNLPLVFNREVSETVTVPNGIRWTTHEDICTPKNVLVGNVYVLAVGGNPPGSAPLTSVSGNGIGSPGGYWRLVYYSEIYRPAYDAYPWQASGRVDAAGKLVGLPANAIIDTTMPPSPDGVTPYPGNPIYPFRSLGFYVQVGCRHDDLIHWPGYQIPVPDWWHFLPPFMTPITPASDFPP